MLAVSCRIVARFLSGLLPVPALLAVSLLIVSCSFFETPHSTPEVTSIQIHKSERRMHLLADDQVVQSYDISLGSNPIGHKVERGDGRTPVGTYYVDRLNPASQFHLSIGINYPDVKDRHLAQFRGVDPGDNIFIHGQPTNARYTKKGDWTEGCVAVSNREIEAIYGMVRIGLPVHIYH